MFTVLNIVIIALTLLIGYWWGNQGLFSAILHLLCVVAAGAIALAFWEPLTFMLLKGTPFDNYAWGFTLIVLFVISLFVLRVTLDRIIPGNVRLPHWADLLFGGPVGVLAGVLTMGMFIIGAGYIQSLKDPFDYGPFGRGSRNSEIGNIGDTLWLPVDQWTSNFYSRLSVTSLSTPNPLLHTNPDLWKQASYLRDTAGKGKGQFSLKPSEARITSAITCPETGSFAYGVHFKSGARDFGAQLTLSRAQIRLISAASGIRKPLTLHPVAWWQSEGYFLFDDRANYVTSQAGQESLDVVFEFQVPAEFVLEFVPKYLQIRNIRYDVPRLVDHDEVARDRFKNLLGDRRSDAENDEDLGLAMGGSIDDVLQLSTKAGAIRVSTNQARGTLKLIENNDKSYFVSGEHLFESGGPRPSRKLAIQGLFEPSGVRIVQLDVSRDSPASIFGPIQKEVSDRALIVLVDNRNQTYSPYGYIHISGEGTHLKLEPTRYIKTQSQLPLLPLSGTQRLKLLFMVTLDVTIVEFRVGDIIVGTSNLKIIPNLR